MAAVEKLLDAGDLTEKIDVTQNPPKESVRYFFALLGMAALFGGQIGMIAICRTQPNLSALGARRAVGALSPREDADGDAGRQLGADVRLHRHRVSVHPVRRPAWISADEMRYASP